MADDAGPVPLLDVLAHFAIEHEVDKPTKKRITSSIVNDPEYPRKNPKEHRWYNASDVNAMKALAAHLWPKTDDDLKSALLYGEYLKALSATVGFPIDLKLLDRVLNHR